MTTATKINDLSVSTKTVEQLVFSVLHQGTRHHFDILLDLNAARPDELVISVSVFREVLEEAGDPENGPKVEVGAEMVTFHGDMMDDMNLSSARLLWRDAMLAEARRDVIGAEAQVKLFERRRHLHQAFREELAQWAVNGLTRQPEPVN